MSRLPLPCLSLLVAGLASMVPAASGADPSSGPPLRIQKVGDITYFHVRLETPRDLIQDTNRFDRGFFARPAPSLAPRLVGADDQVRLVCQRFTRDRFGNPVLGGKGDPFDKDDPPDKKGIDKPKEVGKEYEKKDDRRPPRQAVPVRGLEFIGRTTARGEVKLKLLYPVEGRRGKLIGRLTRRPPAPVWKEMQVVLDFGKAKEVPVPAEAAERKEKRDRSRRFEAVQPPVRDDLEGLWAVAQVDQFVDFDNEVREFGFYAFAASAAARKYGVFGPNDMSRMGRRFGGPGGRGRLIDRELYETTTGAAAIAESLQLRRMNEVGGRAEAKRIVPIEKVRGIDIAEHPWEKMMEGKKPAQEAFARMIPHDNYYIHFKRIAKFIEFSDLLDQWGTNITRAYEVTSRDHRLKERYQQQICLRSTVLGKKLGPLVIRGVALTGSDAYLREGSDLAIVFEVIQKKLFFSSVEQFINEARKKFGSDLQERKTEYNGITIESYSTPLREVSLYRATIDDFVIYANSPVGVRRILDTYQGRGKRLSDSLDFQYMRTIFRYDDKDEDGFAFLSDAFIRALVGPASKIKERRRLEAMTSLYMLTNGAMYTSWETGKPPGSSADLMKVAGLERHELPMPEGGPGFWDLKKQVARSDAYNTIHFATPLIELPINDVTRQEADEYERFRLEYLGLWRQFFDPIGMRVSIKEGQVKLDTYILPLIENTSYNQLRRITGQKAVRFNPASLSEKTLMQYMIRLSSNLADRESFFGRSGGGGINPMAMIAWAADPVGEWFVFRVDDSPIYAKLMELAERADRGDDVDGEEVAKLVWKLPIAIGADIRNPLVFAGTLATIRTSVKASLPGALIWEPLEKDYKGVSIVRIQATPTGRERMGIGFGGRKSKDPFLPALYYAMIDGGFYLTLNEEMIRSLIDGAIAKREGKATIEVASSLYVAPKAAEFTGPVLRALLENQTYQQARSSLPVWYALYKAGIVSATGKRDQAEAAAYRYLGYVPVSPDGSAFSYDRAHDEVVNERHGSFRKPTLHKTTTETSQLNFLLDQLRSVRADLRFREDGIHTVVTLERGKPEKK